MNYMNLSLAWMGALNMALALSGCTNGIETGLSAPEEIPVTVLAEISPVTKSGEAVSSDILPFRRSDKGDKDKKGKWDGGSPIGQLSV